MSEIEISVVVLGFRAGRGLVEVVEGLTRALDAWDASRSRTREVILVVNDWPDSQDNTPDVARRLAVENTDIVLVDLEKGGGMGWDFRSGLHRASGDIVVVMDGDGQIDPTDVCRSVDLLEESGADLVVAHRIRRHDGIWRKIQSRVYNLVAGLLFVGLGCRDINGKPKAIRKEALAKLVLLDDGWFVDAEMLIQARQAALRVVELPTEFHRLGTRPSFVGPGAVLEFMRKLLAARMGLLGKGRAGR